MKKLLFLILISFLLINPLEAKRGGGKRSNRPQRSQKVRKNRPQRSQKVQRARPQRKQREVKRIQKNQRRRVKSAERKVVRSSSHRKKIRNKEVKGLRRDLSGKQQQRLDILKRQGETDWTQYGTRKERRAVKNSQHRERLNINRDIRYTKKQITKANRPKVISRNRKHGRGHLPPVRHHHPRRYSRRHYSNSPFYPRFYPTPIHHETTIIETKPLIILNSSTEVYESEPVYEENDVVIYDEPVSYSKSIKIYHSYPYGIHHPYRGWRYFYRGYWGTPYEYHRRMYCLNRFGRYSWRGCRSGLFLSLIF